VNRDVCGVKDPTCDEEDCASSISGTSLRGGTKMVDFDPVPVLD
jgi:hypothetical protein